MPCIFCIAVFMALGAAATAVSVDKMERDLEGRTATPVKRVADTESVAKLEFSMAAAGKVIPVAITVFKDAKRARIQILSHELEEAQNLELEDRLAELLGLEIVERSDPKTEALVHHAFDERPAGPDAAPAVAPNRSPLRWPFRSKRRST